MNIQISLPAENEPELVKEFEAEARHAGLDLISPLRFRSMPVSMEVLVALGSAGAFTTLYQVIASLLAKNKDRELTIERDGLKLVLKGHSLPEEKELLQQLAPELDRKTEQSE